MPQLRGLSLLARDPRRLADFYRRVFELETVAEGEGSISLSDGAVALVLLKSRGGPTGFRSSSFQVDSAAEVRAKLAEIPVNGAVPGAAWTAADPDGNLIDVVEKRAAGAATTPFPIRHIALYTPDPARLAEFYCGSLGMREVQRSDRSSIFVSDGYFNLALLFERPGEERPGYNHFGFHVTDIEAMRDRAAAAGLPRGARRPDRIPFAEYRLHDPEGNGIDISVKGWRV
jgi:catechol 2,3-dioxygenase-like lactoylglutathione lyase family enzyme